MKTVLLILSMLIFFSSCGGGGGGSSGSAAPTVPTNPVSSDTCTDSNSSNSGSSLPCSCNSGYSLSTDGTTCTLVPPSGGGGSVTYSATYSNYTPNQAATTPCSGSVTASRSILTCTRSSDSATVSNTLCTDPSPTTTVSSRSGSVAVSSTNSSLTNGIEYLTCAIGQTTGTRAITCSSGYHVEGASLAVQNCYSSTKVCDTMPTGALTGYQYYTSSWGSCQISTCDINSNYVKSGNSCVLCSGNTTAQSDNTCQTPAVTQYLYFTNKSAYQITSSNFKVWGYNNTAQLALNDYVDRSTPGTPTFPTGRSVVKLVQDENSFSSFAIMDDGSLMAWGSNIYGILGVGDTTTRKVPTLVNLGSGKTARDVVVGENSACAILNDRTLKCWGDNPDGRLGIGSSLIVYSPTSVNLGTGKTAKKVIMANSHGYSKAMSCAILDDDTVKCWGYNADGRLGDGTTSSRTTPVSVGSGLTVKDIQYLTNTSTSDRYSICAIASDDSLKCWGTNDYGKLGVGDTSLRNVPTNVNLGTGKTVKSIYNNAPSSMCAILNDDTLKCWGRNNANQIGDGSGTDRYSPTLVNLGTGKYAKSMITYSNNNFVILTDNTLVAWGNNYRGQLGISGAASSVSTPQTVTLSKTVKSVAVKTDYQACLVYTDNTVACAGDNIFGSVGNNGGAGLYATFQSVDLGSGKTAVELYNDGYANCALLNDSTVKCWGYNNKGQLGVGDTTIRYTPVQTL